MSIEDKQRERVIEFNESRNYFEALGIAAKWQDCKCRGNGWCELHDHFNPEDDGYAV